MSAGKGGLAVLAGACAAAALAACLKEAPLVAPGRVYDLETAIRRANYASLDSIEVMLVDEGDTARVMRLWGGPPDAEVRLPAHVAGEDERWFFRVEGFLAGKGRCYSEVIREGVSTVRLDICHPRPAPRFVDSVLAFDEEGSALSLRIQVPAGYAGPAELICRPNWITVGRNSISDEDGSGLFFTAAFAEYGLLGPGTHSGAILLRDGNGEIDTLEVRAMSRGIDLLPDTLRFDDSTGRLELSFTNPYTVQPGWHMVVEAAWLTLHSSYVAGVGFRPGYPVSLLLEVNRHDPPLSVGKYSTRVQIVASEPRVILDSMVVILQVDGRPPDPGLLAMPAVGSGVLVPGFQPESNPALPNYSGSAADSSPDAR